MANLFTAEEEKIIVDRIAYVEANSTGEVRIYIESTCPTEAKDRTLDLFVKYGVDKTVQRNGVLIYIAYESRVFYIWGDEGIHAMVGQNLWEAIIKEVKMHFAKGEYVLGLCHAIDEIGLKLATFFPRGESILNNELPDDIIYGNQD